LPKIQQTETGAIFVILVIFVGHYCDAIVVFQRHAIASLFLSAIPSAIAIKNSEVIMSSQNILQQIKNSHSLLPASRDPRESRSAFAPYAIAPLPETGFLQ